MPGAEALHKKAWAACCRPAGLQQSVRPSHITSKAADELLSIVPDQRREVQPRLGLPCYCLFTSDIVENPGPMSDWMKPTSVAIKDSQQMSIRVAPKLGLDRMAVFHPVLPSPARRREAAHRHFRPLQGRGRGNRPCASPA